MRSVLPFPREPGSARWRLAGRWRSRWLLLLAAIVLLAAAGAGVLLKRQPGAAPLMTAPVVVDDLAVTVENTGAVRPARSVDLPFQVGGQVRELLVQPGAQVAAGQAIARLDDTELQLQERSAAADLATAQARLAQAKHDAAANTDLVQAQANLRAAEAQLQQARAGATADERDAAAAVRAAQAQFDALRSPDADAISAARLRLTEAQANVQSTRDGESAAKTRAQSELDRAVAALTQAQSHYSTASQSWQYVQSTGNDPIAPTKTNAQGKAVPNRLNDAQRQQYYDAFVQADAAMRSAEQAVAQARVDFDSARQKEAADVPLAEAQVADAQQQLDALLKPSANTLAAQQAALDQARARLGKLKDGAGSAVAEAQAQVDKARAELDAQSSGDSASSLVIAGAAVDQAQAALDQAKLNRERATLRAPFAGTVSTITVVPGSVVAASGAAATLVDTSASIIALDLSEADIARVKVGQPATITFDALPDVSLSGQVSAIATTGTESQGVVTYAVEVRFEPGDAPVKPGMSANVSIEVERHAKVVQVPTRALTSAGATTTVQVLTANGAQATVQVNLGASNGTMTEIVSCPQIGRQCLRAGDQLAILLPTESNANNAGNGDNGTFQVAPVMGAGPGGPPQIVEFRK